MSWWNAKYKNNHGECEITFASKDYEKAKAVEKVCCAVMDNVVKSPLDVEAVVRCEKCIAYTPVDDNTGKCVFLIGKNQYVVPDGYCYLGEQKGGAE